MEIISDFNDYYDKIKNNIHHQQLSIIKYLRRTESLTQYQLYRIKENLSKEKIESVKYFANEKSKWSLTFFHLGFCKKMYSGVIIALPETTEVSYTQSGAIYIPSKNDIQLSQEIQKNIEIHFLPFESHHFTLWDEIDAPTFIILPKKYNIEIFKNPNLSHLQFYKNVDPFDTFYRIKHFLHEKEKTKPKEKNNSIWDLYPFFNMFTKN